MSSATAPNQSQFDRSSAHYDRYAICQRRIAEELVERLQRNNLQPRQILDVGSGTGFLTDLLSEHYPQARTITIDHSLAMLQMHREKQSDFSQLHQVCGSFDDLPFQPGSFDLIVSNMALHWSQNLQQCWENLYSVLSSGGLMMVALSGPGTFQEWQAAWQRVDDLPHLIEFPHPANIASDLFKSGFVDSVVDSEDWVMNYATFAECRDAIKKMGVGLAVRGRNVCVSKQQYRYLVNAYEAQREADYGLPLTFDVTWCCARKPSTASNLPKKKNESYVFLDQIQSFASGS